MKAKEKLIEIIGEDKANKWIEMIIGGIKEIANKELEVVTIERR